MTEQSSRGFRDHRLTWKGGQTKERSQSFPSAKTKNDTSAHEWGARPVEAGQLHDAAVTAEAAHYCQQTFVLQQTSRSICLLLTPTHLMTLIYVKPLIKPRGAGSSEHALRVTHVSFLDAIIYFFKRAEDDGGGGVERSIQWQHLRPPPTRPPAQKHILHLFKVMSSKFDRIKEQNGKTGIGGAQAAFI